MNDKIEDLDITMFTLEQIEGLKCRVCKQNKEIPFCYKYYMKMYKCLYRDSQRRGV